MPKRTPYQKEQAILRLIVLGNSYPEISNKLDIPVSTIKKIRMRNSPRIESLRREALGYAKLIKRVLDKTYDGIERILDANDRKEIDLSIKDLLRVSDTVFKQLQLKEGQAVNASKPLRHSRSLSNSMYSH